MLGSLCGTTGWGQRTVAPRGHLQCPAHLAQAWWAAPAEDQRAKVLSVAPAPGPSSSPPRPPGPPFPQGPVPSCLEGGGSASWAGPRCGRGADQQGRYSIVIPNRALEQTLVKMPVPWAGLAPCALPPQTPEPACPTSPVLPPLSCPFASRLVYQDGFYGAEIYVSQPGRGVEGVLCLATAQAKLPIHRQELGSPESAPRLIRWHSGCFSHPQLQRC